MKFLKINNSKKRLLVRKQETFLYIAVPVKRSWIITKKLRLLDTRVFRIRRLPQLVNIQAGRAEVIVLYAEKF